MAGTFVYIHGTGVPNTAADRVLIKRMLEDSGRFDGWEVECPAWGDKIAKRWKDPAPALPSAAWEATIGVQPGATFDDTMESIAQDLAQELEAHSPSAIQAQGWRTDTLLWIATTVIEKNRLKITRTAADFIRNVFFYFQDRERIRQFIIDELRAIRSMHTGPLVVAGHSLGGVIAVDVLTHTPLPGTLLVTAGSQMPLFALMGLASPLGDNDGPRPFAPWLNLYNERDPLAFLAEGVSASDDSSPSDYKLTEPRDLPDSHTAYFSRAELYDTVADELARRGL